MSLSVFTKKSPKTTNLIESFSDKYFILEDHYKMSAWDIDTIIELLNITEDELQILVEKTKKSTLVRNFNANFFFNKGELDIITSVGMFLMMKEVCGLKKYEKWDDLVPFFGAFALDDLIAFQGHMVSNKKKSEKKSNLKGLSSEDIMEFKGKAFDSSLKVPNLDIEDKSHLFYDKRIVITGTFSNFPQRTEMAQWIKEVGGDNNTTISKKTNFVIVGEKAGPAKMKKIEAYGIKILTEQEFLELFPTKKPKFI